MGRQRGTQEWPEQDTSSEIQMGNAYWWCIQFGNYNISWLRVMGRSTGTNDGLEQWIQTCSHRGGLANHP